MIPDGEKWCYPAVKRLSVLLRGVTLQHVGDFYCLNCFDSYSTKCKLEKHFKVCKNHDYCYAEMPNEDNKILKYNHGQKSTKFPYIIYADLQSLLEQMSTCHNNPGKSSMNQHTPSGYSVFQCWFDPIKSKLDCYRGKDCMKKFYKDIKEHATCNKNYQ